jgi:hypothetical protein
MMANVAFADGAEQRIGDRVANHVGIRMSFEPAIMRDLHAAQD